MLPERRFGLIVGGLAVWAVVVWVRLFWIQVVDRDFWQQEAFRQREKTIEIAAPRGDILSRDGRILAGSLERITVYANPRQIPLPARDAVAAKLATILGSTKTTIAKQLAEHDGFFYLAKDLDPEIGPAIEKLRQRGVGTLAMERRIYPHGALAAQTIGFVDAEGLGKGGLESYYDRTLRGVPSEYRVLRDGKISPTPIDLRLEKPGRAGQTLVSTLDCRVQQVVEEELARTISDIGAEGASAVVMGADDGEILALASLPGFDPNKVGVSSANQRRNRAVEDAIEPGSTFKPFIVAAALTGGVLSPWELVDCSGGGIRVAGVFFHDHANYGILPVREMLAKSSNTGAIRIAYRVGNGQLDDTIRAFGFGKATKVELPGEARGLYRGPQYWSAVSRAGLALGQEINVTSIQLARAYAALANGGFLVQPHLVMETRDGDGQTMTPSRPQPGVRVLPTELANNLAGLLEAVVEDGTGKGAEVPGFRVAGKTGTAQKAVAGSYAAGQHAAWFVGFFPQSASRLVIVVCIDKPESTYWAADVAAPAFGRIANRLVTVLAMTPNNYGVHT